MTNVIYVVGNDGSGKSTYSAGLENRLSRVGLSTFSRHYYSSFFRGLLRRLALLLRPSKNKKQVFRNTSNRRFCFITYLRKAFIKAILAIIIWPYQVAMALEIRCLQIFTCVDYLIIDRSFVDDLIGIKEILNIEIPLFLVKISAFLFPIHRVIHLSAGHEIEYARIVDNDLTKELHYLKGKQYDFFLDALAAYGVRIKRIDTGRDKGSLSPELRST